jgi:TRAP transporter TAXI family solute receptor
LHFNKKRKRKARGKRNIFFDGNVCAYTTDTSYFIHNLMEGICLEMKKKTVIVALLLTFSLLIGCGKANTGAQPTTGNDQKQQAPAQSSATPNSGAAGSVKPLTLTMAAGSAGGASQAIGESIGETIKKTVPGTSFTYQPSKYGANAPLVGEGKAELGLEMGEFVYWAKQGTEIYKKAYPNLTLIGFMHELAWTMQIAKDTGITSVEQIVETKFPLKISVNTKNGGLEYPNRWMFKEYGFSYDDIEKWGGTVNYSASGESGEWFKDRKLNAVAWTAQQPISLFYDFYKAVPVNWLEPSPQVIDKVIKSHKSLKPYTVPASLYKDVGLTKDYNTFTMPMVLIANKDMSEDTAYTIAKALYNNIDYLKQANGVFRDLNKDSIVPKIEGVSIHPGAVKFYREVGLLK